MIPVILADMARDASYSVMQIIEQNIRIENKLTELIRFVINIFRS